MKRVVLYTMEKCPHCQTAKRYLDEQKIPYRLCNVKTPRGQKEFAATRMRGVPVLKIGDELLNGFSISKFNQLFKGIRI
ncbi:NrdH-redoxin [Pseudoalteromonas sp. S201]|uniref:glutaredoxin family protein n=1 Tax=Pseudoalteromonas sp. S201 TaxID=579519 RepID=UPI00110D0108|nr:glutaredoxin family protein [Pseudoalteromonas sp. S201]TMS90944.1 NrdH-redoxin [Pseudoalteromonas sp. S201]